MIDLVDALVILFARCRELGIEVPEELPLDTRGHQRAACVNLAYRIWLHEHQQTG